MATYATVQAHAEGRRQAQPDNNHDKRHEDPLAVYRRFRSQAPHLYGSCDERLAFLAGYRNKREEISF